MEAYRRMAKQAGMVWRGYGLPAFVECLADDVRPSKLTSFPQRVELKEDETVVISWIVYKSRTERDRINEQLMKDPPIANLDLKAMPFDGKGMFWDGFEILVDL